MATEAQRTELSEKKPFSTYEDAPRRHSFFMWLLFFGYALISIAGWVRMIQTFIDWNWLSDAQVWPGPWYLAATGALWGVVAMVAVIWLWLRRSDARLAAFVTALFLALSYWTDRLLVFTLNQYGANTLFAAAVTLAGLAFATAVLQPWGEIRSFIKR